MRKKLSNLKKKRVLISAILVVLFVLMIGLIYLLNPRVNNIKISKVLSNTKTLSASVIDGVSEGVTSNNYDEIKYQIKVEKENDSDEAVITGTLTDNENKYARFKDVKDAVVTNNGKTITITTTRKNITVTVVVENAPYGVTINPTFTINSIDSNNSNIDVEPVTITGKSVEGIIKDENGTLYNGVELSLVKNGNEVKRTYAKDNGKYVFSLGSIDSYEVRLVESKYKIVRYEEETTDSNRRVLNIVIKEVEPFTLNMKKTITKLDLVINGKKETFNYNDETKVLRSINNAKTIEGSIYYNIYLKNVGEVKGTVTALKDVIPEGMSFDESKNPGWTKEDNNLFYTPLEGTELDAFEKTSVTLVLDIVKTDEAKTYINTAIAHGDDYKYVVYYLNNNIYKELYVINSDKIDNIDPHVENFAGWYTDRSYTNKYNFNNTVSKDIALYGKIDNNKYNVTFIDKNPNNNAETILATVEVPEGDPVDLVNHPEYNGYTFKCFTLYNSCYNDDPITGDTELYTSYELVDYDINYDLDGGTVAVSNPTRYTVRDEITLNNPTKEGYTFLGWTGTGLDAPTLQVTIPVGSTGERNYTANYQINRSTLTINPNGGTYEDNSSLVSFTEDYGTIKVISESERRGYNFLRYVHTGGGTYQNLVYTFDDNDGTLTAEYEIINYEITYDNITEEERAFLINPTEYNVETETFTLRNPNTRVDGSGNNYQDFLGWDDGNGNVSLTVTISKGSIGDKSYTAVWRENGDEYGITYNLNGGAYETGKTNPSTYTRQTATFTLNNPSKNGYTFLGWTGTDLTGNTVTVTIPKGSAGDRAYTANYEVIPYEIHYHGLTTEEETTLSNPTGYNVESNSITLANPIRVGYEFIGWSGTDIDDKSISVLIPTGSTGDRDYTANFVPIEYSLTYTLNGGDYETGKTNPPKYTIESDLITLNNPSKEGYNFIGWSGTDLVGNTNMVVTIPTGSIGHRSYLANYEPIEYTITYDYDGGALPSGVTNIDRYTIESPEITFNSPVKEGYNFTHYTMGSDIITSIPTGSMGNKSLKANYQIKKFNVNFYNGDLIHHNEEVNWNETAIEPSTIPEKAHHIFLYWSEDGTNPYEFSTPIVQDKNLYAIYEEVIAPTITLDPILDETTNRTWVCSDSNNTSCGVTVTITSDHSDYELYYKIGDGEAHLYTEPFKVYENVTITAFSKKSNIFSAETNEDVINVDSVAPTINNPGTGAMSFNMTVSGTAQDAGSGVKQFTLYVKEKDALDFDPAFTYTSEVFDGIKDHAENYDHTFYGVEDNTEYIVKIVAEDYVGNISEKEVEVKTHPYVARVVGKNNMLWYTVDPDTKEFVIEDGKEFLLFDSIQSAINYCAEVQCTIQTNPILPIVNESSIIGINQNITIDLDGRGIVSDESDTFVNNGELHIVDRNPRLNGTEHESIGFVNNTVGTGIVNNNVLIIGDGSSEASDPFIYPELDRPIIEGKTTAIEQNKELHFYDGKIKSDGQAITDNGDDVITQYSYNVIIYTENNQNVASLDRVTDPEARIRSTYYAKLKVNNADNAFDSSRTGTVESEEAKILSKIKQAADYGFIYDAVNDEIYNGNNSTASTTALSYLKIDLTNETNDQYLMFDTFVDSYNANSYGFISLSDSSSNQGTIMYKTTGNDVVNSKVLFLEKGKVYYVYFGFTKGGGDINVYETFKITNLKLLGERQTSSEFTLYNDPNYYSFEKNNDGKYASTNGYGIGGYAHSYAIFDLRNETDDVNLLLDISVDTENGYDTAYVYLSDNTAYQDKDTTTGRLVFLKGKNLNKLYNITLEHGKLNYVHFGYWNYHSSHAGPDSFIINSITLSKTKSESVIPTATIEHNQTDTYYFDKIDYEPVWKDLSGNDNNFNLSSNLRYDEVNKGFIFSGDSYGYIENSDFGLTDYEESVYVEYSTTNTNNTIFYMGSNKEKIGLGLYSNNFTISQGSRTKTFTKPDNYSDGNKHSLLCTYKDGVYNLYFDGELLEARNNTDYWGSANANTYISGRGNRDYPFNGEIYAVKVYNTAITPEDMATASPVVNLDGNDALIPTDSSYINNNSYVHNSSAHSYLTYDLTNIDSDKYLYVNTNISSQSNYDIGYIKVTDTTDLPANDSNNYLTVSGSYDNQSAVIKLTKNRVNYVHFVYTKNSSRNDGLDRFLIKDVRLFNTLEDAYSVDKNAYSKVNQYYFDTPVYNTDVDTIEILKDITLDTSIIVPQEKKVILDLNGFTLTTNANDFVIKNNGNLTIIDSDFEDRHTMNVNYITEQSRMYEEAKEQYLADKAEYEEYAGLCDGCSVSEEYKIDHILDYADEYGIILDPYVFDYVSDSEDKEQVFSVPFSGTYKLEVWGAQGGSAPGYAGGYGGYSVGETELTKNSSIYVNVGEAGSSTNTGILENTYNGGGIASGQACGNVTNRYGSSGGGATSIATISGQIKDLDEENDKDKLLIVAGGGGGGTNIANAWYAGAGGHGGGYIGNSGQLVRADDLNLPSAGGSQTEGGYLGSIMTITVPYQEEFGNGLFGLGGSAPTFECGDGGGGGGGFYGGGGGNQCGGGGGSGYIGNSLLTNKKMVCYNCAENSDEATKTVKTTCANATATEDCAKSSNGYAKITLLTLDESEITSYREQLTKTYNIKQEPRFIDYLDDIDFDGTININQLTPDDEVSFNNIVSDDRVGSIISTGSNILLNEQYGTLTLKNSTININVNSKNGVHNRGLLVLDEDAEINANNASSIGVFNESNGSIIVNGGVINAKGSSSIGLLNRSDTPSMNGIKIITSQTNAIGLRNEALNDITFTNLDLTGSGIGFREFSSGNTVISNSNIKSTGNSSFYNAAQSRQSKLMINTSNLYGQMTLHESPKDIVVNNSTLTTINNSYGMLTVNSSSFNSLENYGETIINDSTLTSNGSAIINYGRGISNQTQSASKLFLNNSIINSTATSSVSVITNNNSMTIFNTVFNNINGTKSTVITNANPGYNDAWIYNREIAYLNIIGNTTIDPSFGTAISNNGTVILGTNEKGVKEEYTYGYTGKQEVFVAPETGIYKLETWGASGAYTYNWGCYMSSCEAYYRGGLGGYASGTISLTAGDTLYIHVGGQGSNGKAGDTVTGYYGSYNGGGAGTGSIGGWPTGSGGGATDISLSAEDNTWYYDNGVVSSRRSSSSYAQRLVVAGGGSGGANTYNSYGGYNVDTSTSNLGYGARNGGGGYYGGSHGIGGSSYVSDTLTDIVYKTGEEEMPSYTTSSLMQGNYGNGYAKITLLSSEESSKVLYTPSISATNYGITGPGKIIYYDGTINAKVAVNSEINIVPDNYDIYNTIDGNTNEKMILVANNDSRPVESGEEFVAAIGNAKYTTIQNAIDASNNGDQIDLLVNIEEQNKIVIPNTKTITIDYKGHTVKSYNPECLYENHGNLTIKDSTNTLDKNTFMGDKYIYNDGTLNVSKIFIDNHDYSINIIENDEGIVTLDSVKLEFGNHSNSELNAITNTENGVVTINDSTIRIYYKNYLISNNGTLNVNNTNLISYNSAPMIVNNSTGNAILDGNTLSLEYTHNNYGMSMLSNSGNATVKNMAGAVSVANSGIINAALGTLTLEDNNVTSGRVVNSGLLIINSGTYGIGISLEGAGKAIDNTEDLYSLIMHNGTINTTLSRSTSAITNIENGTISVTSGAAISNSGAGIINLGINDGSVDPKASTKPIITGKTYGIYTSNPSVVVNLYDGIVSGQKSFNTTIGTTETGYSIAREYDSVSDVETKYLTNDPMFTNDTQGINYSSVTELNNAITNGLVNNNDVIKVYRNITINQNDDTITIPIGLKLTFDINNKIVEKNNNALFTINGELDVIDSVNNSTGKVDSMNGSIFVNNGTLNVISGTLISEKSSIESEVIKNNENATLSISGGTLTKYYDALGYRNYNSGSIVNNSGIANVTGGTFYSNSSYVKINYKRTDNGPDYIYSSAVFKNKTTGVLTVTGGDYTGINSNMWTDADSSWSTPYNDTKGELIYNHGTATITGITSHNSHIGANHGTLTMTNVTMPDIIHINGHSWHGGSHVSFYNEGTVTFDSCSFTTYAHFAENIGNMDIINTTIDRLGNGVVYYASNYDEITRGGKNSYVIRNYYNSSNSNELNIVNSYIYNKGSGEVFENRGKLNITSTTIEASNNNAINNYSAILNVKGNSSVISATNASVYVNASTFTIGEPIEVDGAVSKTKPDIKGSTYGIETAGSSTINFYDGIISGKTNTINTSINNIETGYMLINDIDGDYKTNYLDRIEIIQNITQATPSDEKKYYDLKAAFDDANDGDTLQMIANYTNLPTDETVINNHNVIFDLNGKYIKQSNSLLITNNGTLTITDNTQDKEGNIMLITGTNVIDNYGTLNFIAGKISTSVSGKTLVINRANATLEMKYNAILYTSAETQLIDNYGETYIYNGAYLYTYNYRIVTNYNILEIIDLNNDDDDNTSSTYSAPWLYNYGVSSSGYSGNDRAAIGTSAGSTTTIYGGTFGNGSTTDPTACKLLDNGGTTNIKNLEFYASVIGHNTGTLNIENSNLYNFYGFFTRGGTSTFKNVNISATGSSEHHGGTLIFDNVTVTSNAGQFIDNWGYHMIIRDSNFSVYRDRVFLGRSDSIFDIKDSTFDINSPIDFNSSTVDLDNVSIHSAAGVITSTGTITVHNNSSITSDSGDAIRTSGVLNVLDTSTVKSSNGYGIFIDGNSVLTLGEIGGVPNQTLPYVEGSTYGIYRNTQTSTFNFYDGLLVGQSGPNALYGGLTNVESGYETEDIVLTDPLDNIQKHNEYLVVSATSVAVAKVGTYSFASVGTITPSDALQNAVNFAKGNGTNIRNVDLLTNIDLINDQRIVTSTVPITINTNGYSINQNSTYYLSSNITLNNNSLGGNISRIIADIFDLSYNPIDIIVYEMNDGTNLDSLETYKLYKDGELVTLAKEELGRYRYKGKNEDLVPIKGRLYIDNLSKGSYRLESSDNKYIEFSIDDEGHISGNVVENTKNSSSSSATAKSEAELILSIQTGITKHYYVLAIIPSVLLIILLLLIMKKYKERNE